MTPRMKQRTQIKYMYQVKINVNTKKYVLAYSIVWLYKSRTFFQTKYSKCQCFCYKSSCFLYFTETTSYEYKNEDKTKCSKQTPENVIISDTVLIISVGSLLWFMLILVIIREVCLCCRFPQPVGRKTIREAV